MKGYAIKSVNKHFKVLSVKFNFRSAKFFEIFTLEIPDPESLLKGWEGSFVGVNNSI